MISLFQNFEVEGWFEALEIAILEKPDLILMDIALPGMDGIQATMAIRRYPGLADVPIIALTAYGVFYEEKVIEAGCNRLIHKPVEFDVLRPLISEYIH